MFFFSLQIAVCPILRKLSLFHMFIFIELAEYFWNISFYTSPGTSLRCIAVAEGEGLYTDLHFIDCCAKRACLTSPELISLLRLSGLMSKIRMNNSLSQEVCTA